ncbi:MAG: hypothetical protein RTV72_10370 [Candidatus Thorarchaeota archaeon]
MTPIICSTPTISTPVQSSVPSGIQDIHEPRLSIAPLPDHDRLMRGINMAWYSNTQTTQFILDDDTVVEEDITPYWFKIGFDLDIVRADLDALQTMGVRHIRISALIFQFLNWQDGFGSMGLNTSVLASFNSFLKEVENRGMILTVSLLGPLWSYSEHPSLMKYFRIFNETTGMSSTALFNLGQSMVILAEQYETNNTIHTWELVGGFSRFTEYLSDPITGFGLVVDSTSLFDFLEDTAENIRTANHFHFVTIGDGWPLDYDETWWSTGFVPNDYDEWLLNVTDYIALCHFSDNTTLGTPGSLFNPGVIVEITSSQPYNHSRTTNSEVLLAAYVEAINKRYSGFCPWEFSQNIVIHDGNDSISNHQKHAWTWDALLLFSLYRNNSVKFINTTNGYVLSTEPQLDQFGRISFTLFHRPEGVYPIPFGFEDERIYNPADGGTIITVLSENLLVGNAQIINRQSDPETPLYGFEDLGTCDYAGTMAIIYDVGIVRETGIRVESNHTWEASVERYDDSQIVMDMNTTGPIWVEIRDSNLTFIEGTDYTISYTDRNSGATWIETVKVDGNLTIGLGLNVSSVTIRITSSEDAYAMISISMSVSAIVISLVIFCYADKRTSKEK